MENSREITDLGVHSKASNFAVYSELGQFPLIISVIASVINFWIHTLSLVMSPLSHKHIGNT